MTGTVECRKPLWCACEHCGDPNWSPCDDDRYHPEWDIDDGEHNNGT